MRRMRLVVPSGVFRPLSARAATLERRDLLAPGAREEELVVVEGRAAA